MWIEPTHEKIFYNGRIDWKNENAPVFVFPATYAQMRFTGNFIKIHLSNRCAYWDNYLGYILDGKQGKVLLPQNGEFVFQLNGDIFPTEITSVTGDDSVAEKGSIHELIIFKRQDSCHEITFLGVELEDGAELLDLPKTSKPSERKLLVFGDSVSAGEVSEAIDFTGKADPVHNGEYSNSWYSYAWMTARKLNAQIHDIAQGGVALMNGTGWFYEPQAIGMESVWDKIHYNPELGVTESWDLMKYIPQVVIVAIGQNDSHPVDHMKEDYEGAISKTWRKHYKQFLQTLRTQYPNAQIVCITTLLEHDSSWDRAISQVVGELGDEKITQYLFKRNGSATPGHLRISEAEEMSEELAEYLQGTFANI